MKWVQESYHHGPTPSITYEIYHLIQKPLKYYINVGHVPNEEGQQDIQKIKDICEYGLANNIQYLTYYYMGRIKFPFQCQYLSKSQGFELTIFKPSGDGRILSKIYKYAINDSLTEDDKNELKEILCKWHDAFNSAMRDVEL